MSKPDEWTGERIARLHDPDHGISWDKVCEITGLSLSICRHRKRRYLRSLAGKPGADALEQFGLILRALRQQPRTLRELSGILDRSEASTAKVIDEMVAAGYSIIQGETAVVMADRPIVPVLSKPLFPTGSAQEICLGVVSDTHGASHYEQPTALADYARIAVEEYGVEHILHAGDAFAGIGVYRGQESEVCAVSGEDQANVVAFNLPQRAGLHWWMLGGNHDYSFYKQVGLDVRQRLAGLGRDDITLLPYDVADVPLLPGIEARMWHPSGGIPYAVSYRGQKGVEQIAQAELMGLVMSEKPAPTVRLVIIGHLHVMYQFDFGPIAVLGAGCFEGQTSYLKRKGLVPHIGGWVLRCRFVDGMLHRIDCVRIRYREIEDDWRTWWVRRQAKGRDVQEMQPLFSLANAGA